jgi:hypothetical protein
MGLLDNVMADDAVLVFCDPDTTAERCIYTPRGVTHGEGSVVLSAGQIVSISVASAGFGYQYAPPVLIEGNGKGARAVAVIAGRVITGFTVTAPGEGYTSATVYVGGLYANVERDPTYDPSRSDAPRAKMFAWLPVSQVPSIDSGGDKLSVAYRRGSSTVEDHLVKVLKQDAGMWRVALGG